MAPNMIAVLLFMFGCAAHQAQTEYDHRINFKKYKTYDWIVQPDKPFAHLTASVDPRWVESLVKDAVAGELKLKGLLPAAEEPDLLVAYHTKVKTRINTTKLG